MKMQKTYKIIIMSDLHLGMNDSKPKEILNFLSKIQTDALILNGDIIDIDALNRGAKWKNKHTKVLLKILEMSKKTKVIYVRGNHDDVIKNFFNSKIVGVEFVEEYEIYIEDGENEKRYLVMHGDKIENFDGNLQIVYHIGSIMYDILLRLNNYYNIIRRKLNLPYHSLSKAAKTNVKKIMSFIFKFETKAIEAASKKGYDGIICGHIHTPTIKKVSNIEYMNSGDWVENKTAIALTNNNEWLILDFD
jgi:UDP-2,3-diacylglucosamine pyrophosphatase LpxH